MVGGGRGGGKPRKEKPGLGGGGRMDGAGGGPYLNGRGPYIGGGPGGGGTGGMPGGGGMGRKPGGGPPKPKCPGENGPSFAKPRLVDTRPGGPIIVNELNLPPPAGWMNDFLLLKNS